MKKQFVFLSLGLVASISYASPHTLPGDSNWVSLSSPSERVIWVGSDSGQVALSTNGGESFEIAHPAGQSSSAHVRQIHALDERHAFVLTSGRGEQSRLYVTRNAGFSWRRLYRGNGDEQLRCFAMIPDGEAWILADTLHDNWHVVRSSNGANWIASRSGFSERPQHGEQASNVGDQCARFENNTWIMGTRNADTARLITKGRNALRFQVRDTPMQAGPEAGIHAVWPFSEREALIAGGNASTPELMHYRREGAQDQFTTIELPESFSSALTVLVHSGEHVLVGNEQSLQITPMNDWSWQEMDSSGARAVSCYENGQCWVLNGNQEVVRIQF